MYTGFSGEIGEIIPTQSSEKGCYLVLSKVSFTELIQMLNKLSSTFAFSWCIFSVSFKSEVVVNQIGTNQDWQTSNFFSTVTEIKLSKSNEVSLHQIKNLARSLEKRECHRPTLKNGLCSDITTN